MAAQRLGSDPTAPWRKAVSEEFAAYVQHEASASVIRNFESFLVPGLLQTRRYAREVLQVLEPDKVGPLEELRMQRQENVLGNDPPDLHIVIDENVITRQVGSADIMDEQVNHIRELASQPHITVSIVPRRHGLYLLMRVPFVHLESKTSEDVLYVEEPLGEKIITEASQEGHGELTRANYRRRFLEIERIAVQEATDKLLREALGCFA